MLRRIFVWSSVGFIFLNLLHYFSLRPLWLDEQYVFASVHDYNYLQIFGPLKTQQAFPRVYLVIVKFLSQAFDYHLLALRFFSLVSMLAAFFVWIRLYQRHIKEDWVEFFSILAFVCSFRLSYYAAELKPYSMDVLVAGLFCGFFYYQEKFKDKSPSLQLYCLSGLLPFLIFFSYAGLFIFWIAIVNFLILTIQNRRLTPVLIVNIVSSLLCYWILYHVDLRHFIYFGGYYSYWKNYFLSVESLKGFFTPFGEGFVEMSTWWYGDTRWLKKMAMGFVPILLYALIRYGGKVRKGEWGIFTMERLAIVLFLELIVLSVLKKYPFTGDRITLFMAPLVFCLIAQGIYGLKRIKILYWTYSLYYPIFLFLCFISAFVHYLNLYPK